MLLRHLASALMLGSLSTFAVACSHTPTAATPPIVTVTIDAGTADGAASVVATDPSDAGEPSADAGPDFFACAADTDCVAVPKNSCCNNGFREAVNKGEVDAYRASFTCEKKRKICPMFRIRDTRTPHCNADSHKCELVKAPGSPDLPAAPP